MARTQAARTRTQSAAPAAPSAAAAPVVARTSFDTATVLGLASGFGLVAVAMVLGGSPRTFFDAPSLLIVVGGTIGVTLTCFNLRDMAAVHRTVGKALVHSLPRPDTEARRMLALAEEARKKGMLSFDDSLPVLRDNPFLTKVLSMVADGFPVDEVERVMRREIDEMVGRHRKSASVLRKAAEIAPAMGLIGTLIGLVQMLGNLDNPASIGPSMAVALITTFYGAVLANMLFSPLAAKLERNSAEEALVYNLYLLSAVSMGRKENPRRLEMLLNALLPPAMRVRVFD